ncbi:DNA-binding transcriptional regulator [Rhizobium sp. L1K21]|uniref:helix-turn-helix domain-containing protein n=1 Tax=Rhizobium sp. L1K21 TaxID=2954933 RepID=UPI002093EB70|nr:helix-turn-helix domain-containing protein [Rhizobium sp. L1K21]MCO6186695.1 transcriptional regulator [Rhizobium sp. L1K21]
MSDAGNRLIKSALQAREIAKGNVKPAKAYIPAEIDVKAIRAKLRLTQDDFASEFGFTVSQIRDWEQNRYRPLGSDRAYLLLIDRHPETLRQLLREVMSESEGRELPEAASM